MQKRLHKPSKIMLCLVLGVSLLLSACDTKRLNELEQGVSTEADVREKFGEPAATYTEENGNRTLEYPRQPAGQINYMITIDADGKMGAMRQVLKLANFAKIQPGWDKAQVRRLLGKPAKMQTFALKKEEIWDWRFADGQESKVFSVSFDLEGRVKSTATAHDPVELGQKG
jgi:outer membrane protein assembly factor BamE (lipoprotein component of BamABCDE complex)